MISLSLEINVAPNFLAVATIIRSAWSPCIVPGSLLLSIAISGVIGAIEIPGAFNALLTQSKQPIGNLILPFDSSMPTSHTDMTETLMFEYLTAFSM